MRTDETLWYKDAVIYEVHVRSFSDASGTGSGDFRGLTAKLDYLEDLGVTAVWVQPFYPSPLRDDGYDISNYTDVNPTYGTLDDFKTFLKEAHRRGIRVITELVINHTSDQHPWFQKARRSPPGSPERAVYVWSDDPNRYPNVPLMFPDFESSNWAWDPVAGQYYWHRFYSHQPDLNFDNPAVWEMLYPVVDFWFDLGVDGMRLDAVPYLYEREGTSCEHLPETHAYLKALRAHVDARYKDKMFLAEANAWPEDAVRYFGDGDECHMAFHFPLMPRLFMSLVQEDRFPIVDIFDQTPAIPDNAQWCLFLRNHDELTLAMVTDEERDSMFRAYARDPQAKIFLGIRHRLAPLLKNDRRRIELMNALLFSLPGTPVIYYGDEIGMGDNIYLGDRNGVRTPMQWSADRNAGFSRANPQRLYAPVIQDSEYHFETVNVEAQQNNPSSLLWWTKRLIAMRKTHRAFGRGTLEFLKPDNPKILAFVRRFESEVVLVVANLSRFVQHGHLDLREFAGLIPEEMTGHTLFPAVGEGPFPLALGAYGFYWFSLRPQEKAARECAVRQVPALKVFDHWAELVDGPGKDELEVALPDFLAAQQLAEAGIVACRVVRSYRIPFTPEFESHVAIIRIEFKDGQPKSVVLPVLFCPADQQDRLLQPPHRAAIARVDGPQPGYLVDAAAMPGYAEAVLQVIAQRQRYPLGPGELNGRLDGPFEIGELDADAPKLDFGDDPTPVARFGNRFDLKLYRTLEEGIQPDVEVGRFLAAHHFDRVVPLVGSAEYSLRGTALNTLATLFRAVAHQGTAWQHAQHLLSQFFEKIAALSDEQRGTLLGDSASADYVSLFSPGEDLAAALGRFLADLHAALASDGIDPAFRPEMASRSYQRSVYQTMRNQVEQTFARLGSTIGRLPEADADAARRLLDGRDRLLVRFRDVADPHIDGARIRCHGDCHLGSFLKVGNEWVLADFAGDVSKSIGDRRIKRSPLRDLASLLMSFDYVLGSVTAGLDSPLGRAPGYVREEDRRKVAAWSVLWRTQVTQSLTTHYLEAVRPAGILPSVAPLRQKIIELFLLEKALARLDAELQTRPDWANIPLGTCLRLSAEFD